MTCLRARRRSKFGAARPPTVELAALKGQKKPHILLKGKNGIVIFSWMFVIGSSSYLQVTMTYIRTWMSSKFDQIRPRTTVSYPWASKNRCCHFFSAVFHLILFLLTGNFNMQEISEECSKSGQIWPQATELAALELLKKISIDLWWEKSCCYFFSAVLDRNRFHTYR